MKRFPLGCRLAAVACLIAGCQTVHYRVDAEATPGNALEPLKQDKADIPVRIQVVDFVVNSVDATYSERDKDLFRRHNAVAILNLLYSSLGARKVFTEVSRSVVPAPAAADYTVSGTYDFSSIRHQDFMGPNHSITDTGTLHVRVARAKDNAAILDKDFVESHTDEADKHVAIRVHYLQHAFIESVTAEIKVCVAADAGVSGAKASAMAPR
jgi:hypothetical protein